LNLISTYDSLAKPIGAKETRFSVHTIDRHRVYRIGKDSQDAPALLISIEQSRSGRQLASVVLEHLTVQHGISCLIVDKRGREEHGRFTLIRCRGGDRTLYEYFLRILNSTLIGPYLEPSVVDITHAIEKLVELFHAMTIPPRKSLQGLWSELFLISQARDMNKLINAWHKSPEDRYDFSAGEQRIEVKSAGGRLRRHHFSLEQLHPPAGSSVIVASLFVEGAGAGTSLSDLIEKIRGKIGKHLESIEWLDRIVALALGASWKNALGMRFDSELAKESMRFFKASEIPSVDHNLPLKVSDVHFISDLTGCPTIGAPSLRSQGGIFEAM
jgi:putative PD-(D/E)XK family protein DUF4420